MRTASNHRMPRSQFQIPWKWIIIIATLIGILFLSSALSKKNTWTWDGSALKVVVQSWSEAYITPANGSQKQITGEQSLYTSDNSLSVSNGTVQLTSSLIDAYIVASSDQSYRTTEIAYKEHTIESEKLELIRGQIWIESHGQVTLQAKNFEASIMDGNIVLVEQNPIVSTLYALKWDISLTTEGRSYTLTAGKKIMISKSDLSNPGTTLDMLSIAIGDSLAQNPLFLMRNGSILLQNTGIDNNQWTLSGDVLSNSGGALIGSSIRYIDITTPTDLATVSTATIDIAWKILSKDVTRVTIDDVDAIVSPVDESFILRNIPMSGDIMNIVYKAYSKDSTILERWVLTLYPKNKQSGTDKLTPNNFPVNDKDYHINSPVENPYKTTDSTVTVSGTVPRNTVQYIMVNNFRLKKFVPNSTTWYYYASTDYDTMKDGINLYEIVFYGSNNQILYKQLFTIVKEAKGSVSGETIQ